MGLFGFGKKKEKSTYKKGFSKRSLSKPSHKKEKHGTKKKSSINHSKTVNQSKKLKLAKLKKLKLEKEKKVAEKKRVKRIKSLIKLEKKRKITELKRKKEENKAKKVKVLKLKNKVLKQQKERKRLKLFKIKQLQKQKKLKLEKKNKQIAKSKKIQDEISKRLRKKEGSVTAAENQWNEKGKIPKFKLGIPGFDSLFREGIPEGASVLVEGGPGSGKTNFCLQLAYNAAKSGKKVLFMSFEEPEYRLKSHMKGFGWDVSALEKKGNLRVKRFNALDIARSVEALLSEAKKELLIDIQPVLIPKDFKPDIVLIDSLSSIASAFSGEDSRFRIYMEQLFRYLEANDISSFLIRESPNPTHLGTTFVGRGEAVSFLSDGIIILYNVIYQGGKRERAIEVLKMRGEDIHRKIVKTTLFRNKGFVVHSNQILKGNYTLS